eukprot:scaffold34122_cov69-Phaeocystis_antarctica.AAC.2
MWSSMLYRSSPWHGTVAWENQNARGGIFIAHSLSLRKLSLVLHRSDSVADAWLGAKPRGSGTTPALTGVIDQRRGSKVGCWGTRVSEWRRLGHPGAKNRAASTASDSSDPLFFIRNMRCEGAAGRRQGATRHARVRAVRFEWRKNGVLALGKACFLRAQLALSPCFLAFAALW